MTISAKVIQKSLNKYTGTFITTFELDYPRMIHSELMTHRMFSRNAQSSRAVPVSKTLDVNNEWVKPLEWGKNKSGMSADDVLQGIALHSAQELWDEAAKSAFAYSKMLAAPEVGLHKQYANRITEPFSRIKVVVTATEFDNFYWLRDDPDAAQPEIVRLARVMKEADGSAEYLELNSGDFHVPYIHRAYKEDSTLGYFDLDMNELSINDALKISASCCAQVSYRNLNQTKEKALEIYDRLFSGPKPHLSPVEHQGCCFNPEEECLTSFGITHLTRDGSLWSGNLRDFVQFRQMLIQAPIK